MAWYLVPYKRTVTGPQPGRYCAMDDFTAQIRADGGAWSETEILGNMAIVKVRASAETLQLLNAEFTRIPVDRLKEPLSSLTAGQLTTLRNRIVGLGYNLAEIREALGDDLSVLTLKDVLRFMASRRQRPRYDAQTDTIVCDGRVERCRTVESVEQTVLD